jgi:Xaa-Pro aminopeptidase
VALVRGAADTRNYMPFRQGNDFYYLSGVEVPGALLLIDAVQHHSILFLPARAPRLEQSEGSRLVPGEESRLATGVDQVLDVSKFAEELEKRKGQTFYIPYRAEETAASSRDRASQFDISQENDRWDGRPTREKAFDLALRKKLGNEVSIKDLSPILDAMRLIKDSQEIERLREASRIACLGLKEAMRTVEPGMHEYQVGAVAEFVFRWEGASGPAYFPIVGSGPNSCVLHYNANNRKMEAGDIVVMDFGPDFLYYDSDVTRTFPVSGTFTAAQRKVYDVVLEAQKAALALVRPGATFRDINAAARTVIDRAGYGKNWAHGVSHYIGMATHDVGGFQPLEPGIVLTVEPGVYIPEQNLGVRIEDTVLVTKDGYENLSKDVPKEIAEIEKLMAEKSLFPKAFK